MVATTERWQHRDIITNGIRMHYVTQGSGPLVLLLHGFPEFWYSWRHQITFLAEHGYTVVAPDLRGYNDTDKPRKGYDIATLLRDIEGLIQGLGQGEQGVINHTRTQKAIIVGHDWGGVLAWAFAIRYPDLTERLIVMNAPHPQAMYRELRTLEQLRKSWYIFFFQLPWLPEYVLSRNRANAIGSMLRGSALQKTAFERDVTAKYQQAMSKPGSMTAALNYYRQMFRRPPAPATPENSHVSAPTLLIWGEQDIALGLSLTTGLEGWVPNLTIKRLPDSGHWVQQEQPEQVNQLMLEFLKSS
jgi:epoxide hydrolase 4